MTVNYVRLQGIVEAWDRTGVGDLPDEVALALDADPEFRVWFDTRLKPWTAVVEAVPPDLEQRFLRVRPQRSAGKPWRWAAVGAVAATALFAASGVVYVAVEEASHFHVSYADDFGPRVEGEYFTDFATVDRRALEESGLMAGLEEPFRDFVMTYNAAASGRAELVSDPTLWDRPFYEHVVASTLEQVQYKRFFRRLEDVKDTYAEVVDDLHAADLPEVFAGIPFRESAYLPDLQSNACAVGWWQLMPEVANRYGLKVKGCHLKDAEGTWEPASGDVVPPAGLFKNAVYISGGGQCRISRCDVDDRSNLGLSTAASITALKEVWADPVLRDSGALVQIALLSHNAGYDDARYGVAKKSNLLPAFKKFARSVPPSEVSNFYGATITCTNPDDMPKPELGEGGIDLTNNGPRGDEYCGSMLHAETQHYAYPIVARHMLAVCYYGQNHADMPAFAGWAKYTDSGHYCTQFNLPTPSDLR